MTQQEYNEGNLLIAQFMGGDTKESCKSFISHYIGEDEVNFQEESYPEKPHDGSCWKIVDLKYHTSLDWQIPVINRINAVLPDFCTIDQQKDELYVIYQLNRLQLITPPFLIWKYLVASIKVLTE